MVVLWKKKWNKIKGFKKLIIETIVYFRVRSEKENAVWGQAHILGIVYVLFYWLN